MITVDGKALLQSAKKFAQKVLEKTSRFSKKTLEKTSRFSKKALQLTYKITKTILVDQPKNLWHWFFSKKEHTLETKTQAERKEWTRTSVACLALATGVLATKLTHLSAGSINASGIEQLKPALEFMFTSTIPWQQNITAAFCYGFATAKLLSALTIKPSNEAQKIKSTARKLDMTSNAGFWIGGGLLTAKLVCFLGAKIKGIPIETSSMAINAVLDNSAVLGTLCFGLAAGFKQSALRMSDIVERFGNTNQQIQNSSAQQR